MNMLPDSDLFTLLAGATLAVKMVLLFLAAMSLWSWTIIFYKFFTIGEARKKVMLGYEAFTSAGDLSSGLKALGAKEQSPLSRVSTLAVKEFRLLEKADVNRERKRLLVKDTLRRVLKQGISKEMRILTRNLPFLATCANAAPFIGLFGTVWGIMHSFHSIGLAQSAALATVAPGISEALIATAIGLLVAIPATIFYNYFLGKLNEVESGMIDFAGAFLNRAEREITWASKGEKN
ncbi:MAG: MotA/TolQ/ExbB proton channel family protein [Pseudodesulfovibrio sp.]|uniref:MotA/TolQ/ExbB proton channel n=1 Tax=Pseudodesulfovibrio aespoeensis (strain ATCC 700646 / DSM 10631 / Aspo-2) TaxID=643562 RepID=E6VVY7_PSEA9|nr:MULTISPECIES: MotA/TolQ/ExbB proton channel family protein [Pseudodesulfovibrio]MBU4192803.1 MotA/TolQ/ExbB proton channel family protein [Pseudomonadota bacterium]ADU62432.1 MotA/TolQ/ExbB proton channel [Pseudodesulfovibrio aespoeensis Aspo-2]MBU4244161.1 MotA/TolQ/ExbB proton channel family protein [Pseudomonadota bacterium]MBU4377860.1 MotA/TolQ/ExbB proton channel family protein [Pseudomonadota bacterium]MBU4473903.1 MotA/TolQ/ExbB proton channel family protein [Pseudomonadota bacteriu